MIWRGFPLRGAVLGWLAAAALAAGCADPADFPPRTRIGTVPKGFAIRPVVSVADASSYAGEYLRAVGVEGVRVERALGFPEAYWAYATEVESGRGAFSLEVSSSGQVSARRFPSPEPELMWNQKYGHRARPRLSAIQETLAPAEAEARLREALPPGQGLGIAPPVAYYGYALFPLCGEAVQVGEGAVSTVDGRVVLALFPAPPEGAWAVPGVREDPCR